METTAPPGTFRLFRALGITVYVHWLWFLLLVYELQGRRGYTDLRWSIIEFLCVFGIVTLHEFGHALACRSVGGRVHFIVLWLLGGVAYVSPPQRPGAVLWSIAAGPLVNVLLVPVLYAVNFTVMNNLGSTLSADAQQFFLHLQVINLVLLCFNLLPIYPLDGGQIVQALLWFVIGRRRSLSAVAVIGMLAAAAVAVLALLYWHLFLLIMALFIGWQAWRGFQYARLLARAEAHGLPIEDPPARA